MSAAGPYTTAMVGFPGGHYPIALTDPDDDYIQQRIFSSGEPYEPDLLAAIAELTGPDDLVLDVGANIGNHTLWLAHATGARVWAFEPNHDLVTALKHSVRLGSLEDRVVVFDAALGSSARSGSLVPVDAHNLGSFRVDVTEPGAIEVLSLDDLDVPRVSSIKIDVEGMELDVLRGSAGVLERDHPQLFIETAEVAEFREVADFLEPFGYTCVATYNATPTHHFAPSVDDPEILRRRIHELVAESRGHHLDYLRTRTQLHETSDRYRAVTRQEADRAEEYRQTLAGQKERIERQRRRIERLKAASAKRPPRLLDRLRGLWRR